MVQLFVTVTANQLAATGNGSLLTGFVHEKKLKVHVFIFFFNVITVFYGFYALYFPMILIHSNKWNSAWFNFMQCYDFKGQGYFPWLLWWQKATSQQVKFPDIYLYNWEEWIEIFICYKVLNSRARAIKSWGQPWLYMTGNDITIVARSTRWKFPSFVLGAVLYSVWRQDPFTLFCSLLSRKV